VTAVTLGNYRLAYREICRALAAEKEPLAVEARSGCRFDPDGSFFEVPFLGRSYRVAYPSGEVTPGEPLAAPAGLGEAGAGEGAAGGTGGSGTAASPSRLQVPAAPTGDHLLTVSILIVHYLVRSTGTPVGGEWIAFRELPGGDIYNVPFTNRTIRPMVALFGPRPAKLVEAFLSLGGRREKLGHWSASVRAFPMVPVCFVLWEGDEEIPASGQILFDKSAPGYMETEAVVVLAAETLLAARMVVAPQFKRPGTLEAT